MNIITQTPQPNLAFKITQTNYNKLPTMNTETIIDRFLSNQDTRKKHKSVNKLNKCTRKQRNGAKGRRTASYWESVTHFQNKKQHKKHYDTFRNEPTEEDNYTEYNTASEVTVEIVSKEDIYQSVSDTDFAQQLNSYAPTQTPEEVTKTPTTLSNICDCANEESKEDAYYSDHYAEEIHYSQEDDYDGTANYYAQFDNSNEDFPEPDSSEDNPSHWRWTGVISSESSDDSHGECWFDEDDEWPRYNP
jgi:hypothetical protein